jgi:hypothetical protein
MIIKKFNEVNLNLGELGKKIQGTKKGQKLVDKLRGDQDFTVFKIGEEGYPKDVNFSNSDDIADQIVSNGNEFDDEKAKRVFKPTTKYKPVLRGEDDETYRLNDLKKDEYFGSGGGSSLGFEDSKKVESIQCLFLSLKQYFIHKNEIDREDIKKIFTEEGDKFNPTIINFVRIPQTITPMIVSDFLEGDKEDWIDTFLNTANALYDLDLQLVGKKERTVLDKQKKYVFHQISSNSKLIFNLSDAYHSCRETVGIPIPKWTPSDVWAVEVGRESAIINQIGLTGTIDELNKVIDILFRRSQLVGLSLKKVGGKESIKLVINKLTPPPAFYFDGFITSGNPFGSKSITLEARFTSTIIQSSKDRIVFRSFSGDQSSSDISGEILGSESRFGKIGLLWVNKILQTHNVKETIPTKVELLDMDRFSNDFLKSEIERMNGLISNKTRSTSKIMDLSRSNLISKYQGLKLSEILSNKLLDETSSRKTSDGTRTKVDDIVQDIFYYAMAIKNEKFTCPMYVRIVTV